MAKTSCIKVVERPKWMLSNTGLWPIRRMTKYEALKLIFSLLSNIFLLVFTPYNVFNAIKSNDIEFLNSMICVLIPVVNYTAKAYTITANRECLQNILNDLGSDIFNAHTERLNRHVQIIYTTSKILLRYFIFTITLHLIIRGLLPILVDVNTIIVPPPFDMGRYEIIYKVAHFLFTGNVSFNSIAFDVFYLSLLALCVAQLNILSERLENVFENAEETNENGMNFIVAQILKECITLHETINQYTQKLNDFLSFPLFVQYTCGCFILCDTVLLLQSSSAANFTKILGICAFFGITFGQMAAFHWLGNEIIFKASSISYFCLRLGVKSDKIIESSFTSKWYKLDIQSQKMLLILMERAKRPLEVKVYRYISISFESLGVIFRWAYSVFALMKARW